MRWGLGLIIQFVSVILLFSRRCTGFTRPVMTLTHQELQKPVGFTIVTRMDWTIESDEVITFTMPRFTNTVTANGVTSGGGNIDWGNVRLTPSMQFDAKWTEGSYTDPNGPFTSSKLEIRLASGVDLGENPTISITIGTDMGFNVYCGFPNSFVAELGVMSTDVRSFFVYSSLNAARGRSNDDIVNYAPFGNYPSVGAGCSAWNNCNNNGDCDYCFEKCNCRQGFGNTTSDNPYKGGGFDVSCKTRMCPLGKAITDVPTGATAAHAPTECSNAGICNRELGVCECMDPFTGAACDRLRCPNDCSGHGKCLLMSELALNDQAQPTQWTNFEYGTAQRATSTAWDMATMTACLCDSKWEVGMNAGERQLPQWFGADCSLQRCPSSADPFTHLDEENCYKLNQFRNERFGLNMMFEPDFDDPNSGRVGNLCHIDCSRRGICDYTTGKCECFPGSYGEACSERSNTGYANSN